MIVPAPVRRFRLVSGLILFAYATTHLINHMAGLISLPAMEAALRVQNALWTGPLGLAVLYGCFAGHAVVSLTGFYLRRDLELRPAEAWQLGLGLAIPPLLVVHIVGTRGVESVLGAEMGYPAVLLIYFELSQVAGLRQLLALLAVWAHGCLGIHLWLRYAGWYRRWRMTLFAAALLVPTLALAGVWMAGRQALEDYADGEAPFTPALAAELAEPQRTAFVGQVERAVLLGYGGLLLLVLAARGVRRGREHLRGMVAVAYPDGRRVRVPHGTTILEASREGGIAHAALCGGRGRCSTCRVRIGSGFEALPPPSAAETRVLERVGAAPNVRLACQTRPAGDVAVQPLLPPNVSVREARSRPGYLQGEEREIVVLFADLRGFTSLAESRLPYDVVFLLNRYFRTSGEAVQRAGGRIDKYIGDGVMALFGLEGDAETAARAAVQAAREMAEGVREIDRVLGGELAAPLRIGIGIHAGPAIVGEMGWGEASSVTAIGDTVNTASRLEQATKDFGAELVVSAAAAERAGLHPEAGSRRQVDLRGRRTPLDVRVFVRAAEARATASG